MSEPQKRKDNTKYVVTKLVDSWNVGIKNGYIGCACTDPESVKQHMRSVGITVFLDWEWDKYSTKFIMVKTSDAEVVSNPFS